MRWLVSIMAVALGCLEMHAQSDYHERQAKSHVNDAAYYVRQAQGYDRDVEYYTIYEDFEEVTM